jgi:hypothetical protein
MTLTKWLENGWLRRHRTSREEKSGLQELLGRYLADAGSRWEDITNCDFLRNKVLGKRASI